MNFQEKINYLLGETTSKLHEFWLLVIHNYQIASGTVGGTLITIMNYNELGDNLILRAITAIVCTIFSFLTSVLLKYIADKIKEWKHRN